VEARLRVCREMPTQVCSGKRVPIRGRDSRGRPEFRESSSRHYWESSHVQCRLRWCLTVLTLLQAHRVAWLSLRASQRAKGMFPWLIHQGRGPGTQGIQQLLVLRGPLLEVLDQGCATAACQRVTAAVHSWAPRRPSPALFEQGQQGRRQEQAAQEQPPSASAQPEAPPAQSQSGQEPSTEGERTAGSAQFVPQSGGEFLSLHALPHLPSSLR